LSARFVLHAVHAPPPVPHVVVEGALHVLPVQQPLAHVTEHPAHAPFTQWSAPQPAHIAPPKPHCVSV
jgi:hypothetical protein